LLDLRSSPTSLSALLIITLSNPGHPHHKVRARILSGGGGGNRTRVQSAFHITSYNDTFKTSCQLNLEFSLN
jgi:hypothetical protein